MQLLDGPGRIRKGARIPRELAIVGIPPIGAEAGSEINHRVAGQSLFAECPGLSQRLFGRIQSAVRLLISERPEWRHLRKSGDLCILTHYLRGFAGPDDEDVHGKNCLFLECLQASLFSGEIEPSRRSVNEHPPTAGSDQKLNRHPGAVGAKLIASLAADHRVHVTSAIELRTALSQPQQESTCDVEAQLGGGGIDREILYDSTDLLRDADCQWSRRKGDHQFAGRDGARAIERADASRCRTPFALDDGAIRRQRDRIAVAQALYRDTNRVLADWRYRNVSWRRLHRDRHLGDGRISRGDHRHGSCGDHGFQGASAAHRIRHGCSFASMLARYTW